MDKANFTGIAVNTTLGSGNREKNQEKDIGNRVQAKAIWDNGYKDRLMGMEFIE